MIKGFGPECAVQLGLVGRSVDTGHAGPDLLDVLSDITADECDGADRAADV
jgi:hypothetical protein